MDGTKSDQVHVDSGVPLMIFLLHTNDLHENVKSHVRLFADACLLGIYRPIPSQGDRNAIQEDLDALAEWCTKWGMCFNDKKCEYMRISRRRRNPITRIYTINGQPLTEVQSTKYLGVTTTQDLDWSTHISKLLARTNSTLGFLCCNRVVT